MIFANTTILNNFSKKIILIFLISFLSIGIFFNQNYLNKINADLQIKIYKLPPNLPSAKTVKSNIFGYDNLAADWYWIKTIQYIGEHHFDDHQNNQNIFNFLNLVTDLDPHFATAYYFGEIILPNEEESNLAIQLAIKGLYNRPDTWQIPYYLGYIYYFYREDYEKATKYFELAAQKPKVLTSAKRLAAELRSKTGRHEIALMMWQNLAKNIEDDFTYQEAKKRITRELNFLTLENDVKIFQTKFNRDPENLTELITTQVLQKIPSDPFGLRYFWDAKKKRVRLELPVS